MTENLIRVGRADDPERFMATEETVWFTEPSTASTDQLLIGLPEDQRFAADLDGSDPVTYPGIYGVFPLTLSIPGLEAGSRQVPCAGLTWVGVHPDHRRKGVLHASEPAIYGRHGYGLASLELDVTLGRGTTFTAPDLEGAAAAVSTHFGT